jgi:flagellar biosynthetic protein FliR
MTAAQFSLFGMNLAAAETLLLAFVRIGVMLSMLPIFSTQQVPMLLRFGLALLLTYVVSKTVPPITPVDGIGGLTAAILSQALIGAVFGFIAFLVFTGVQFAGEIMDTVIGFSAVNIINPTTQQNVTILGEFELALATLLYLVSDSHHLLLRGISGSFNLVPLPYAVFQPALAQDVVGFFSQILLLVFQIAAPVAVALFVVNVALALMVRVAPQVNVFAVGFPLQIGVGFMILVVSLPLLTAVLPGVFNNTPNQLDAALRRMVPR